MKTGKFIEANTFVPMKTESKNLRAVKETKYQIFNSEEEIATLKVDEENDFSMDVRTFSLDVTRAKKNEFLEILEMVKKIVEL